MNKICRGSLSCFADSSLFSLLFTYIKPHKNTEKEKIQIKSQQGILSNIHNNHKKVDRGAREDIQSNINNPGTTHSQPSKCHYHPSASVEATQSHPYRAPIQPNLPSVTESPSLTSLLLNKKTNLPGHIIIRTDPATISRRKSLTAQRPTLI